MTKSFYFYGYVDDEENHDPIWKVLHDHFEALARADDDGMAQNEDVEVRGKGAKRK